jgi:hypothetical protein
LGGIGWRFSGRGRGRCVSRGGSRVRVRVLLGLGAGSFLGQVDPDDRSGVVTLEYGNTVVARAIELA